MYDAIKAAAEKLANAGYKKAAEELMLAWDKNQVEEFKTLPPLPEKFTLRDLMLAWADYTGVDAGYTDTFKRRAEHLIKGTGEKTEGLRGKPAEFFKAV